MIRDNKEVNVEIESKSKRKVAELEASLKEKTKLEEKYFNQLKYARADLENLHKHIQRCFNEGVIVLKKILVQIPLGTQSGTALRLRGEGIKSSLGKGDQTVTVTVQTPTKLTPKEKKLIQELHKEFEANKQKRR